MNKTKRVLMSALLAVIMLAGMLLTADRAGAATWTNRWVQGTSGSYNISIGDYGGNTYQIVIDKFNEAGQMEVGGFFNSWQERSYVDFQLWDDVSPGNMFADQAGYVRIFAGPNAQTIHKNCPGWSCEWRVVIIPGYLQLLNHGLVQLRGGAVGYEVNGGQYFQVTLN